MGQFEEKSRKRTRNQNIKALLLASVGAVGVLAVALTAPNVLGAMAKMGMIPKPRQGEYIQSARRKLKKDGLLEERDGFLRLTSRGEKRLMSLSLSLVRPVKQKRWDKKWRILIFDIPEHRKSSRYALRQQLRAAGFIRVQHSVWIYPYPCEEFVVLLKAHLKIGKDMLYLIVDSLEGDKQFRKAYGLPGGEIEKPIELPRILEMALEPILPKTR